MTNRVVSIELTGTNARAIAALEGTSAAKVGGVVESKMGGAASKVGTGFSKLDGQLAGFGIPSDDPRGAAGSHDLGTPQRFCEPRPRKEPL